MDDQHADPRAILGDLRADRERVGWEPVDPVEEADKPHPPPLLAQNSLAFIHHHWALPDAPPPSPRRGIRSRLGARLARFIYAVLQPYLQAERDLLANMTRMHDATARRVDEIAWDIRTHRLAQAENLAQLAAWLDSRPSGRDESHRGPLGD